MKEEQIQAQTIDVLLQLGVHQVADLDRPQRIDLRLEVYRDLRLLHQEVRRLLVAVQVPQEVQVQQEVRDHQEAQGHQVVVDKI